MGALNSFRDLRVYQELFRLHLEVNAKSLAFPKFEMFELGSQVRRSSNSAAALLAEGWGSRHTNIYLEAINRSKGEIRETQHHLDVARAKSYLDESQWTAFDSAYEVCDRMLEKLHQSLSEWRGTTRTGCEVRENRAAYGSTTPEDGWEVVERISAAVASEFFPSTVHPPPST